VPQVQQNKSKVQIIGVLCMEFFRMSVKTTKRIAKSFNE